MLKDLVHYLLVPMSLGTLGFLMLFLSIFLYNFSRIYKGILSERPTYAAKLRQEGEVLRAAKVDLETKQISARVPVYAKSLMWIGILLCIASVLLALI
ncbi:MAG: hypothetical protein EA353_01650 [Puniceicoccaceae bacterium]|nr:MAG: hypothetical protein EA353_01650 [Puniceicoccaceae bacterium]